LKLTELWQSSNPRAGSDGAELWFWDAKEGEVLSDKRRLSQSGRQPRDDLMVRYFIKQVNASARFELELSSLQYFDGLHLLGTTF
jgi:hypothetical protein